MPSNQGARRSSAARLVSRRLFAHPLPPLVARLAVFAALAVGAAAFAPAAEAALRLNEVLYDPAGDDAGGEFVELWNDSPVAEPLEGVSVEAGDGARPGSWSPIFLGGAGDSAAPTAAFLIPAARLTGAIQNGPDAVRLVRAGVVLDLLGFGALDAAEFFEGSPAADPSSGESLARRADGMDTDRNDADWEPAPPTPGAANHPAYRASIASVSIRPEVGWPGLAAAATATVANRGTNALAPGAWEIALVTRFRGAAGDPDSTPAWVEAARRPGPALASGESTRVSIDFTPGREGAFDALVIARAAAAAGELTAMVPDSARVSARAGVGPVAIDEFAYRDDGAGEWVELIATESIDSWGAFAFADAASAPRRLLVRGGSPGASAGERRVAVADPARFAARFAIPESLLLVCDRGWPALNDGASSVPAVAPFADIVRVVDERGVPSDAVPFEEGWSERGASVERLSVRFPSAARRSWSESVAAAGGTPGAPNSVAAYGDGAPPPSRLLSAPRRVLRREGSSGAGALVLELGPAVADRLVRLMILDLRGRVRRLLAAGERFGNGGAVVWDGRDDEGRFVEPGLYVARVEAAIPGAAPRRASIAIAVAPGEGAR
ncbi:MAG TPA: hypothetical protein VFU59_08650 [Candidatus Eisenbacteria bacterium]|nr:hypothetical protein [Candidatus Eisenbacteria bacterium]